MCGHNPGPVHDPRKTGDRICRVEGRGGIKGEGIGVMTPIDIINYYL